MAARLGWSPERDAALLRMRDAGAQWVEVCSYLRVGRSAAYARYGVLRPGRRPRAPRRDDPGRTAGSGASALPAGSRETWSLISSEPWPGP
jgi:hypothetical protein